MTHDFMNPFTTETATIPVARIFDRERELKGFLSAVEKRQNALLLGPTGIGKTCLLRKLRHEIAARSTSTMLVEVEMLSLSRDVNSFLQSVLLQICMEIWTKLYGRPYSELIGSLDGVPSVRRSVQPKVENLVKLFRIVRPRSSSQKAAKQNEFGAKAVVATNVTETFEQTVSRGDLTSLEFVSLARELTALLEELGVTQVVVFGDEANHLRPDLEMELFRRNFEAFGEQNIQFVFTAREEALVNVPELRSAFSHVRTLGGFESSKQLRELVHSYAECADCDPERHLAFDDSVLERLWRITGGVPREVQLLASSACDLVLEEGRRTVELRDLFDAVLRTYRLVPGG